MAYAAVTCVRSTIRRLQNCSRISVVSSTRVRLEIAYEELGFLQKVVEEAGGSSRWYGDRLNALDGEITAVAQKLEDSLELHELNSLRNSMSYGDAKMENDIGNSIETVKMIKDKYVAELAKALPEDDGGNDHDQEVDDDEEETKTEAEEGGGGDTNPLNMVGLSNEFEEIKWTIFPDEDTEGAYLFSIIGMAGIGKTALAERIFQDPSISGKFEYRAFVKVGRKGQLEAILAQLNSNKNNDETSLDSFLDDKKHLIVLDDVWDLDLWHAYFKHRGGANKGSRILLTTRLEGLALSVECASYFYMPSLNKQESWELLRTKLFPDGECPAELEELGMDIANKCEGLPLMIVTVASVLSEAPEMTPEYWLEATRKRNPVMEDAYERILPVLYPSYNNLTARVKTCFLYMAAFPPSHQIRRSRHVNIWCTEGFLEADGDDDHSSSLASQCFDNLNKDHVVVPAPHLSSDGQNYQACSLHSVFRHLCRKELDNNRLLHIVDGPNFSDDHEAEEQNRRRIAVYSNVLLSIKDVRRSIGMSPTIRSLLCTGPYHQYEVPIDFDLKLLSLCDALTIRFYEFPSELLELVQLRYFAITCNKNLPPCISKLWKLKYLIVHRHSSIIRSNNTAESFVPVEIWDLQELRHLQLIGRNLPNPPSAGTVLPHLAKLLDVGPSSCTEGVLSSIPNLQKLRVQIHLPPDGNYTTEPLVSCMDNLSSLPPLVSSLQCVVVNPSDHILSKSWLSSPPSSIKKLTLSGLGYPWECLDGIMKLPHLQVLKLQCHAFRGQEWAVADEGFLKLECLLVEDSDLVVWKGGMGSFPVLSHLNLSSCYKLKEIPNIKSLDQIEMVDCNPAAVKSAEKIRCDYLSSTWDDQSDPQNYITSIYYTY